MKSYLSIFLPKLRFVPVISIILSNFLGCATFQPQTLGTSSDKLQKEKLLAQLIQQQANLQSFHATGKLTIRGVGQTVYRLNARVQFQLPNEIYIRGDKPPFGIKAFEFISHGPEWTLRLPLESQVISIQDVSNKRVQKLVSQIEPAVEIYLVEKWDEVSPTQVRLKKTNSEIKLAIRKRSLIKYIVLDSDTQQIHEHLLMTRMGKKIMSVKYTNYTRYDELWFPKNIQFDIYPAKITLELQELSPRFF